jgi:hypothetical protein
MDCFASLAMTAEEPLEHGRLTRIHHQTSPFSRKPFPRKPFPRKSFSRKSFSRKRERVFHSQKASAFPTRAADVRKPGARGFLPHSALRAIDSLFPAHCEGTEIFGFGTV